MSEFTFLEQINENEWLETRNITPDGRRKQILKCTKSPKGGILKVDSGYEEIDGRRVKKEAPANDEPISSDSIDASTSMPDLEKILEEREKLDKILQNKFRKTITVMFTDLKGSTSLAEQIGDISARLLIKHHNDIVFPAIRKSGILVKTMGDGTMSYFDAAQNAVRAAVEIQRSIDTFNKTEKPKIPLLVRIGLHTGTGLVEKRDIYGDVVNVASRFESLAEPGEIYLSEETCNSMTDKNEIICRYIKTSTLKGKKDAFRIYKAFWNTEELKSFSGEISITVEEADQEKRGPGDTSRIFTPVDQESLKKSTLPIAGKSGLTVPALILQRENQEESTFPIDKSETTIGRSATCDIVLNEPYISRKHAVIVKKGNRYFIEDQGSKLGIMVNGEKITSTHELANGDDIVLGSLRLSFFLPAPHVAEDMEATIALGTHVESTMLIPPIKYKLVVLSESEGIKEYPISEKELILGRQPTCDIPLNDKVISRNHAKVWSDGARVYLEDLGSNNGTFINNKRIPQNEAMEVTPKQQIRISSYHITIVGIDEKVDNSMFSDMASYIFSKVTGIWGKRGK